MAASPNNNQAGIGILDGLAGSGIAGAPVAQNNGGSGGGYFH